jgi:hypothetical protein
MMDNSFFLILSLFITVGGGLWYTFYTLLTDDKRK